MIPDRAPPAWRLPDGVNRALWEYAHTPRLAEEEEAYFRGHPLFEADARALDTRFETQGALIDLGCGTGRLAVRFARRGFPVVAVDLSRAMLDAVQSRARKQELPLACLQANLCRLECIPDCRFDYALSMFSTLGMIRGKPARRRALGEAYRVLRPGGRLALHAHNLWLNLHDAQGRFWLLGQGLRALFLRPGVGDRCMTYRGIANMEVHLYRWPELMREMRGAGFAIDEVLPIDAVCALPITLPRLLPSIRAGGWLIFARRPG
jgi:SAM-dependent methyltransferase